MPNRFAPVLTFAAWLTASAVLAQPADRGGSTALSGVTVRALPDMTACRMPSDGIWPGSLFDQSAKAMKRRAGPSPGTEEYLRKDVDAIQKGTRDYGDMAPRIAEAAGKQLLVLEQRFKCLGDFKSISFLRVSDAGFDVYEIEFQNGAFESAVAPLDEAKHSHAQFLRFYQPQPVTNELRDLIVSFEKDHPNHSVASAAFLPKLDDRWPILNQRFKGWGRPESIYFVRKTNAGSYIYLATLGRGGFFLSDAVMRTAWSVTIDPEDGKISSMVYAVLDGASANSAAAAAEEALAHTTSESGKPIALSSSALTADGRSGVAAQDELVQAVDGNGKSTSLSGVTVMAPKTTQAPGVTFTAPCQIPPDSDWPNEFFDPASNAKNQRTAPSDGTRDYIEASLAGIRAGSPPYRLMDIGLARRFRQQLDRLRLDTTCRGKFKALKFLHVSKAGWDDYEIEFEDGALEWAVQPLDGQHLVEMSTIRYFNPRSLTKEFRVFLTSIRSVRPICNILSPKMAAELQKNLPLLRNKFKKWGEMDLLYFVRQEKDGSYTYLSKFAHGRVFWSVAPLDENGKLQDLNYSEAPQQSTGFPPERD